MEFSDHLNLDRMSRRERLRVLGIQCVCASLNQIAESPQPEPREVSDVACLAIHHAE